MTLVSVNPATGETNRSYEETGPAAVDRAVDRAHSAYEDWRGRAPGERSGPMREAARRLRAERDRYAELMATEMGKPLREGRAEADKCARVCEFYADNAERFLQAETVDTDARRSFVTFEPLGIVLAVMPWNFPFWQVFRFAAPALMAGNGAILKHASNVPGCALAIDEIFRTAGFPEGLFGTLLVGSEAVGALIADPRIAAVTLTGSTPAGRAVAARAGAELKKTVLELGGSDAYVILEDAELEATVEACVTGKLINGGQSCVAAKRFIVTEGVREAFERRFVESMRSKTVGDPFDERVDVGPQARVDLRDALHRQVEASLDAGARCLLGGTLPPGPGAYYPPTVLTDVRSGMPAHDEELFGPVAAIIPVADEAAALRVANSSVFGLGAAVFTRDAQRGEEIASRHLEAGNCFVNAFVRSDPRLPFGGIKQSGYGRELGLWGIREFVNIKTVYVG